LEKSPPQQRRLGAVAMLVIPSLFLLFLLIERYDRPLLRNIEGAGTLRLWAGAVLILSILVFATQFWARHIPQRLTITLAVAAWATLLWMLFGLGWWDLPRLSQTP